MEYLVYILLSILGIFAFLMYVFLYFFHLKLKSLERKILTLFLSRTHSIPALYEVSHDFLTKHNEVFSESLLLKKREFSLYESSPSMLEILELEGKIHHEINFIFKVCNKHPKLVRDGKFIYLREVFIEKSQSLGKNIDFYKRMAQKFNFFVQIKNYSLIGFLLPIQKKTLI